MKKVYATFFIGACIFAALVAILASVGHMRKEKLVQQPPLTLQQLNQLAEARKVPAQKTAATSKPASEPTTEILSGNNNLPADIPRRLNVVATDKQRREYFTGNKPASVRVAAFLGSTLLGSLMDSVVVAAGVPEGACFSCGESHLIRCHWAEARSYFTEFVTNSEDARMREVAYAYLAWLEEDPELAARYMELACAGGNQYPIHLSTELARQTGSTELAEHYESLHKIKPQPEK